MSTVCAALTLAGCASQPHPTPDLRLPMAYEAPQPAPSSAAASAVQLDRWWVTFGDPQLDALVAQALLSNPDAKTAAARLIEARATRFSELDQYLPQGQVTASASHSRTTQLAGQSFNVPGLVIPGLSVSGPSNAYSANFDVSWEIDLFGRLAATRQAANGDVSAAGLGYESTRTSLAAQVADTYFQARGLAIQLAEARETVRIDQELYDLALERADAGLAPGSDPDRVAGDLAQAKAQAVAIEGELQIERRTLLILTGRTFEPTSSVNIAPFVGRAPDIPPSLPSELLRRRPDVRSAEAQVSGALGRENLARLAFLPTFTLSPGLGWSKSVENDGAIATSVWSLGGAIAQPVLNIPRLMAELRIQNARTAEAVAAYEKAIQTAFGEAEGALVRLDADKRRLDILTDGEVRAERAYEAARAGYGLGLNDLQTALSAEQAWRTTRTQLTVAQVQAVRQAVQAFKAIGGGWPGAVAAVTAASSQIHGDRQS